MWQEDDESCLHKKRASYSYRTATTTYPCFLPNLGDSVGAGRMRLARHKSRLFSPFIKCLCFFRQETLLHTNYQIITEQLIVSF